MTRSNCPSCGIAVNDDIIETLQVISILPSSTNHCPISINEAIVHFQVNIHVLNCIQDDNCQARESLSYVSFSGHMHSK